MKKFSKILFFILIMITLIFSFSVKVNAADDYDDYEEIVEETKPEETEPKKTAPTPTTTQTENKSNTATTSHPQAGVFVSAICLSLGIITIVAFVFAYKKLKIYNFQIK